MAEALAVAHHHRVEHLAGAVLSHGPGDHPAPGVLAVELDGHVAFRGLVPVGQQALRDYHLAAGLTVKPGVPQGGVDAPDLDGVHLHGGVLPQIHDGLGIHHVFAGLALGVLAVMLLRVVDPAVSADVESVDAVVAAFVTAGVVDAAPGHDVHVAVVGHIEVVIHHVAHARLADDDGDVTGLALGAGLEMDVDAGLAVGPGVDGDVLRGLPGLAAHVLADVEGPGGLSGQVGDFFQQFCVDLGDHERASSRFSTGHPPRVSARISGRISSVVPRWAMRPPAITAISSASWMIRSWWEMMIMAA